MKWIRIFIFSAGVILLAAALNRFLIAAGDAQVLPLPDPMLGIPLRDAVIAVGAFELVVALICLFGRRVGFQIGWLAWLGTNYVVFWTGLLAMHCHPQATCIGSLTDPLWLHHGTAGYIFRIHSVRPGSRQLCRRRCTMDFRRCANGAIGRNTPACRPA